MDVIRNQDLTFLFIFVSGTLSDFSGPGIWAWAWAETPITSRGLWSAAAEATLPVLYLFTGVPNIHTLLRLHQSCLKLTRLVSRRPEGEQPIDMPCVPMLGQKQSLTCSMTACWVQSEHGWCACKGVSLTGLACVIMDCILRTVLQADQQFTSAHMCCLTAPAANIRGMSLLCLIRHAACV